jgi:oligopeptide transport system substrate-binding protein
VRNRLVDLLPSESSSATINLFETGGADIVWDRNLFPPELTAELRPPRYHAYSYLGTYFLRMNVTRAPFQDSRVRRAIAMAIDRERIVKRITRGGEQAARSFTPPGCGGYTPPEPESFHLSEARQLMKEAGYDGGRGFRPIEYLVNSGGGGGGRLHEQIAVELQAQLLENLGIRMEIRPVETKIYYSEQSRLNYDLCRSSWLGDFNDPATFLEIFRARNGNNRTGWNNADYDRLLDAAAATTQPGDRFKRLREAESLLTTLDPPIVPLYFYSGFCAFDPSRIEGIYTAQNLMDLHPLWAIAKKP